MPVNEELDPERRDQKRRDSLRRDDDRIEAEKSLGKLDELSKDQKLQNLLKGVTGIIGDYAHHLTSQIKRLSEIGIALSAEHDLDKLLEMIVDEARNFTSADAGTLYIMEDENLKFKIMQNQSMNTRMGGTSGKEITLPPVPLKKENVSAYVALTGETVNILDVYTSDLFDFTGPRKYDKATGYRTKSMLVSPLKNIEGEIIGVLQLINAGDLSTGEVVGFSPDFVALTQSLASQAAVAITNAKLIHDMVALFDSFVKVMATAIDEKSPYTAGHIKRVAQLGVLMCEVINKETDGPYRDVFFDEDQIKEMMTAGWMHDLGKITTPVHVVDKGTKLQTLFDRVEMIRNRFNLIEEIERGNWLRRKLEMTKDGDSPEKIDEEERKIDEKMKQVSGDLEFIVGTNTGGEFMDDDKIARIKEIGAKTFSLNANSSTYLSDDEIENLCIRRGTLLDSERQLMQDHASITEKMLNQIPFTKKLKNVPMYASSHHEYLDGSGYPKGLKGDEIPLGARILCMVDLYEALTASDRPYKKAMPLEKVFGIMKGETDRGKLDADLYALFLKADIHNLYKERQAGENASKKRDTAPAPAEKAAVSKKSREEKEKAALGRNPLEKN
ncbi:MAG: HD domain-containing phosphohydrolase [Nitrospinota bacterium]